MKKSVTRKIILLFITLLILSCGSVVFAETIVSSGKCGDNATWKLNSEGVLTISGSGPMGYEDWDSIDEDEFNYYPFDNGFKPYKVKKVIIKDGITELAGFQDCYDLNEITIPGSVKTVGNLYDLPRLVSVNLSKGVEVIDFNAFKNCAKLTDINIPDSVTSIGGNAFYNCSSLKSITIPNSVEFLGYAFQNCTGLTSVVLSNQITEIENHTFENCTSLSRIIIPEGIERIEENAFTGCTNLKAMTLPQSLKSFGYSDFNLTSVNLPNEIISFNLNGKNLNWTSLTIPETVIYFTLTDCARLTSITIPEGVEDFSLKGCKGITSIKIPDGIEYFDLSGCSGLKSVTLPKTLTYIDSYAFENCSGLTSIVIPESVERIYEGAFLGCSKLTAVYLSDLIDYIEYDVFENHTILYGVPGSYVQEYAEDCGLKFSCMSHKKLVTVAAVPATCSKTGLTEGKKCTDCGMMAVKQNVVAKKPHTNVTDKAVAPTCTKSGKTAGSHCSVCGTVTVAQKTINAKGHTYNTTYTIDKTASTTKNGSKSKHCKVCSAKTSVKTIYKLDAVKLGTTKYVYSGKVKSPSIILKDSKGNKISSSNYSITKPKGRVNVGKYTYKITFKNEYKGIKSKTLTFTINPKSTSITKKPKAAKKSFTVKWKKVSKQATGYEVMYSTNKTFTKKTSKTVTVKSYKTTSKKITKLKEKKTYYVRVRTYKVVDGKKYYSGWSKVKTVKTK